MLMILVMSSESKDAHPCENRDDDYVRLACDDAMTR